MKHENDITKELVSTNEDVVQTQNQGINLTAVDAAVIVLNCALHRLEKGKSLEAGEAIREAKAMLLNYQQETGT